MAAPHQKDNHDVHLDWDYEGDIGPDHWAKHYPHANGTCQSPIDIITSQAVYDAKLVEAPLSISYSGDCFVDIVNNGHTYNVSGRPSAQSKVTGGPLNQIHQFLQFHMHWGDHDKIGSEHLIDGHSYAAELHFVNWNTEAFQEPMSALESNGHNGLCVLGVFVKIGHHNDEFDKIVAKLPDIILKDSKSTFKDPIDFQKMLPADATRYFTYKGSLTTPPCSESVTWVVFEQPIEVSHHQLHKFFKLQHNATLEECTENTNIVMNYRPVCHVNERTVYKSFE